MARNSGISRRDFLMRVGQAGGYGATFATMQALGLMPMKASAAVPIAAAGDVGKGVKLVVAGGGIGGLVTAYEAKKLGYDVTLLEARLRPGGRNWSGKGGDVVEFVDGTKQNITWDAGLYQNLGPGRLPSVHGTILSYCRELKVPLEVEINTSRSTLLQNDKVNGGKPYVQRQALNDTRGHVSELLAKAIRGGALDQDVTAEDKERMIAFLRVYGPLDLKSAYKGSDRASIKQYPGAGLQTLIIDDHPIPMNTLLDANFWAAMMYEETWDWQATMMQPVGGMAQIPYAFAKALGPVVKYDSPVTEIAKTAKGVRVGYTEKGAAKTIEADYVVCAMPLTILRKIKADLDAEHKQVVDTVQYRGSYKIAWESKRFWETDYNIYGGLSFLAQGPSPVWYPSANLQAEKGILVSGYTDEAVEGFDALSLSDKLAKSRESVEKLHPGHSKELDKGVFCGWKHVKWNEGSWIGGVTEQVYETIIKPDGPIYFAGDHASHIVGWQEGAALSAKRAVQMISDKVKMAKLEGKHSATVTV
jgi:monoamine oxidase